MGAGLKNIGGVFQDFERKLEEASSNFPWGRVSAAFAVASPVLIEMGAKVLKSSSHIGAGVALMSAGSGAVVLAVGSFCEMLRRSSAVPASTLAAQPARIH